MTDHETTMTGNEYTYKNTDTVSVNDIPFSELSHYFVIFLKTYRICYYICYLISICT